MREINYSDIEFYSEKDQFKHNLQEDYACFALWKSARPYRDRIRMFLNKHFEVLLETEIEWSAEYFHDNASRLYEVPIFSNIPKEKRESNHAKKIGDNKFILFVVKDLKPDYTFAMSVSKKVELSNLNVVKAKYTFRDWILKDTNVKYGVHSTNNIYEFFFQAPLLLGVNLFDRILKGETICLPTIKKDLEGAGGWPDYKSLFKMLNLTSNYLVLRSFETLPEYNEDKDIDLLTDDFQRLASTVGAKQMPDKLYKGTVEIGGEFISLDMRFIGDKYYDTSWQKDMLHCKELNKGVYIQRKDMYFFSLLFHCKVQKNEIKKKYYGILGRLAEQLNFTWFHTSMLDNDKMIGNILNGYFQSQGYFYEDPIDRGVIRNEILIKWLPKIRIPSTRKSLRQKIKKRVVRSLPKGIVQYLKKTLNK